MPLVPSSRVERSFRKRNGVFDPQIRNLAEMTKCNKLRMRSNTLVCQNVSSNLFALQALAKPCPDRHIDC